MTRPWQSATESRFFPSGYNARQKEKRSRDLRLDECLVGMKSEKKKDQKAATGLPLTFGEDADRTRWYDRSQLLLSAAALGHNGTDGASTS